MTGQAARRPPAISAADRARALELALVARRIRAQLKADVRAGRATPGAIIDLAFTDSDQGRAAARMTIGDLLLSTPGFGEVGADRALVDLGISGDRRLRALGELQRERLRRSLP